MLKLLRNFTKSRSGNFGMMTAILLVPMVGSVGLAVDYSRVSEVQEQLQNAADAAAVGAISESSQAVSKAINMSGDGRIETFQDHTKALFRRNVTDPVRGYVKSVKSFVVKDGPQVTSRLTYEADVPTTFMHIFGHDHVAVSGEASAVIHTASFMDFYLLLDNTPSMGVGARPEDVEKMVAKTGCAIACHETDMHGDDNYAIAKANDVTMRIDVVRQATQNLMQTAQDSSVRHYANQFRMAIYTFGKKAQTAGLHEIAPLSDDLSDAARDADAIDLMTIPKQNFNNDQQTSLDDALTKLDDKIGVPGSGISSAAPQKWVFLVSDGVGDSAKSSAECTKKTTGGRCQEPIDTRYCDKLKERGVKIAVLYTTYLPLPDNDWYRQWIAPFQSEIGTRMEECATPGYYFEVSPTEGVSEAMGALFHKIVLLPRITS